MINQKSLCDICSPKQWKTISSVMLLKSGYPVYGANGIIGYYSEFNHKDRTLLITCRGATCGELNICEPYSYVNGNAMALDNLSADVDIWYLYFYLQHRGFSDVITGSAQPQIVRQSLEKVNICYPDIGRQKQIAMILDRISSLTILRKNQLVKLDELVKARFVEMFGDPVHNTNLLPTQPLSELGTLDRGRSKHRPRNDPELLNGPYPLVQTGEIANSGLYITSYKNTYSELGLRQSKMWNKGTLCITIAANIAQTAILAFDACFPDSVVGFIPNEGISAIYIHYWFTFFQKILEEQAPQVAQKNINLQILSELKVMVPPLEIQDCFVEFVTQTNRKKLTIQQSLDKLMILKKSLMQEYFG